MAKFIDDMLAPLRRAKVSPTETIGAPGTAIFGGFVDENEKDGSLVGTERYRTFSELLANVSIVAAGTRYFLNLVAKSGWKFEAADHPDGQRFAELAEEYLLDDPRTPWHRIVRRAAMYRFYGFSVQEWTAQRRPDGGISMKDIAPRAQFTIDRWDIDDEGFVRGVVQRSPQTSADLYLPRQKLVYLVDDTLSDSPMGLGLFRHLVDPARRLQRYEQLEGWGFETDLRGTPIGFGPYEELREAQASGDLTLAQRAQIEAPMRDFIENHVRNPKLGLLLDSMTYTTTDEAQRPSNQRKWDIDLLKATAGTQKEVAEAIERLNLEMARVLGVEGMLLGGAKVGSLALSRDKTHNFFLIVDGTLAELAASFKPDLLERLWELNGWPPEAMPTMKPEVVRFKDIEQITESLRDMALAGAVLAPDDPAIGEVRDLLGLSRSVEANNVGMDPEDSALTGADGPADDATIQGDDE